MPKVLTALAAVEMSRCPVTIATGEEKDRISFHEDLLFTHRGLSGPAVLQISSYWREGQPLRMQDEKKKPLKYDIITRDGYRAKQEVE